VIGRIVGGPCRDLVAKLHLGADDLAVPRNHLVEMTGLHGDVMKLRLNHHFLPLHSADFRRERISSQIRKRVRELARHRQER
jgi:hypothetical protein